MKEFEQLLNDLTYLSEAERATYYSLFVAADEENKKKMMGFFVEQKRKMQELHTTYDKRVKQAEDKLATELSSIK